MGGKVGENPAALRAAVFFAILEKPEGGAFKRPPPAGRGLNMDRTKYQSRGQLCHSHNSWTLQHLYFLVFNFPITVSGFFTKFFFRFELNKLEQSWISKNAFYLFYMQSFCIFRVSSMFLGHVWS